MAFVKAEREKVWIKLLLEGASGSGKSYSALRVATGLAKKCNSRVAYIGTEGSRDKYYANEFDYDLMQLDENHRTPEDYIGAINDAVNAGYKVVIIDSLTHEWTWLNETHNKMSGNSFQNWGKLKPRHKRFMDTVLLSPIHVVATARGKDEYVMEDKNGKSVPRKVGMGSQQDKDIAYEYTASLMIEQDTHIASADKDNTHLFDGRYDVLTEKDGESLYAWANQSDKPAQMPEPQKFEEAKPTGNEVDEIKKQILAAWKERGGSKNPQIGEVVKRLGNPNALKDVNSAKEYLTAVENIPVAE